jgi:large subunit ribosomal protein L9
MNVILTENVKGLGNMGDVIKVKPGYARNFLLPNRLAVEASERNLTELDHHRRQLSRKAEKLSQEAAVIKNRIEALDIVLTHRAGDEGRLFGAVTSMEIEAALAAKGIEIDRRKILLDQPIKSLGSYEVEIKLNAGVSATLKLRVNNLESTN